jgi:hypothetical protein
VEKHSALEILSTLLGQTAQTVAVGLVNGGGSLDLHAPRLAAAGHDEVYFDLVFVTVGDDPDGVMSGLRTKLRPLAAPAANTVKA